MKLFICSISISIFLLIIGACSSEKETQNAEPETAQISLSKTQDTTEYVDTAKTYNYDSWSTAQYKNIKIIYPFEHPFADKMNDYAKIYKTVLRRNAQFFRLPEPTDSIIMFYYTGFGQGQDLANSEFPTVRGDSVYYWSGNKFGITAAMYMLKQWTQVKTKHKLLYNGIMRLLDASGRDYHSMTFAFIDSGKFIPLADLITDDRTDYNWEAYQSAEAASFIDYFVYKYGIDNFKILYESESPFDSTTQVICNMNLKALQHDWLQVIGQAVKKNEKKIKR